MNDHLSSLVPRKRGSCTILKRKHMLSVCQTIANVASEEIPGFPLHFCSSHRGQEGLRGIFFLSGFCLFKIIRYYKWHFCQFKYIIICFIIWLYGVKGHIVVHKPSTNSQLTLLFFTIRTKQSMKCSIWNKRLIHSMLCLVFCIMILLKFTGKVSHGTVFESLRVF